MIRGPGTGSDQSYAGAAGTSVRRRPVAAVMDVPQEEFGAIPDHSQGHRAAGAAPERRNPCELVLFFPEAGAGCGASAGPGSSHRQPCPRYTRFRLRFAIVPHIYAEPTPEGRQCTPSPACPAFAPEPAFRPRAADPNLTPRNRRAMLRLQLGRSADLIATTRRWNFKYYMLFNLCVCLCP